MATKADIALELTRIFKAPRSLVFKAWTDPGHLERWWGPHGFTAPRCEIDPRPGGALRIDMRGPDGTVYPMTGVVEDVVESERLVLRNAVPDADGRPIFEVRQVVTFASEGDDTRLTLQVHVLQKTPEADRYLQGMGADWTQSLECLDAHLADNAHEILVTRIFDAPRELVFDAWTDLRHLARWYGPNGFTTTTQDIDARPGGVWRFHMHGPDGTDYDNLITYLEVVKPERLVNKHGSSDKSPEHFRVTTTFEDLGGRTKLTTRMVFPSTQARDAVIKFGAIELGGQTHARLADYLAQQVHIVRTFDAPRDLVFRAWTEPERLVLALSVLRDERRVDIQQVAGCIQKDDGAARRVMERLLEAGLVAAAGVKKGRTYTLSPAVYRRLGRGEEYVRQSAFDVLQQEQMVLKYVTTHGTIRRRDVVGLCQISDSQAKRLLARLVAEGHLQRRGERKGSDYVRGNRI